jgi:hypothetical protein
VHWVAQASSCRLAPPSRCHPPPAAPAPVPGLLRRPRHLLGGALLRRVATAGGTAAREAATNLAPPHGAAQGHPLAAPGHRRRITAAGTAPLPTVATTSAIAGGDSAAAAAAAAAAAGGGGGGQNLRDRAALPSTSCLSVGFHGPRTMPSCRTPSRYTGRYQKQRCGAAGTVAACCPLAVWSYLSMCSRHTPLKCACMRRDR